MRDLSRFNKVKVYMDLSWMMYRNYYAMGSLTVDLPDGVNKPMGHVFGCLKNIIGFKKEFPECEIVLCKDGYPEERRKLIESQGGEYKADRPKLEYDIRQDTDLICTLAQSIPNVYVAYNEDKESDDAMYSLAKQQSKDTLCLIYSGDNDLLQSISENIFLVRKFENYSPVYIDEEYFNNDERMQTLFRGCTPNKLPFYRAIVGDKSDSLPGIPRFPKALATKIAMEATDIYQYREALANFKHLASSPAQVKYLKQLEDDFERIFTNYKVMNLEEYDVKVTRETKPVKDLILKYKVNSLYNYLKSINVEVI